MKKVLFVLGIILALIGAAIMFDGSLFGERTTRHCNCHRYCRNMLNSHILTMRAKKS